jgi:stress response protein YsnF
MSDQQTLSQSDERRVVERRTSEALPVAEERAVAGKRAVETGRVQVRSFVDRREEWVGDDLARHEVAVERVRIDRDVPTVPAVRTEGDVTVIPVVEEYLFVEKRLRLKEELRVRQVRTTERVEQPVVVRSTRVEVERAPAVGSPAAAGPAALPQTAEAVLDERVEVERRPVGRTLTGAEAEAVFQERAVAMSEHRPL